MALGYAIPNKAIQDHVNISDINVLKYKAISVLEKAFILWNGQDSPTFKPPSRLITKTLLGRFVYKKCELSGSFGHNMHTLEVIMTNQEATTKENLVVQKCLNPFTRRRIFTRNNQFFRRKASNVGGFR